MTVTVTRPQRRRPIFHKLTVSEVSPLTDDAVAFSFEVPVELREAFAFRAGQHLTVRRVVDDQDVRRSYSICSTPAELAGRGHLRIGVKQVPGGSFSTYATHALHEGDVVEVLPPLGHFTTAFDPARRRHYAAIVAGSGITPVLSLVATALATEPESRFTLLYGNRTSASVMFAEELADLKDRYPTRLHLVHVLSREPRDAALLSGRLDADRLRRLFDALVAPSTVDDWFLCGPYGILLDGRASTFSMGRDERVLDAALRVRGELPYACKGGVCSTCRARLVEGEVRMARNFALEPDELAAGYVLTCQSSPLTDRLVVDYDA